MSRLRELAEQATPGLWSSSEQAWNAVRESSIPLREEDARLIALAPDLCVLLADAKDALAGLLAAFPMADPYGSLWTDFRHAQENARPLLARIEELEGEALARFAGDRNPPA